MRSIQSHLLIICLWTFVVALPDFFLRSASFTNISTLGALTYLSGMAASLLLWASGWNILVKINRPRFAFAFWITLLPGLAVLTNIYFWLLQFEFFAPNVAFMIVHPDYAAELVRNSFGWKAGLALA